MKIVVLISCMNEKDHTIIKRTNIQTDVVVINQCDENKEECFTFQNKRGGECNAIFVSTIERGLSRSRNMAINYAKDADICLICDDDERLEDNYEDIILNAYLNSQREIDVASFSFNRKDKNGAYPNIEKKMGIKRICKTSSVELTFRRQRIKENGIVFDVKMGSGTGNGGGEDTKFMMDCWRKGLEMRYFPNTIGTLLSYNSLWFHGWDKDLVINTGWAGRRNFGIFMGYIFILYKVFRDYEDYKKRMSPFKAFYYMNRGFFQNR